MDAFYKVDNTVIDRVKGKRILLYDLNDYTKGALVYFMQQKIYIHGFLLPDTKKHLLGIRYLNKKMFCYDMLYDSEEYVIIDVFGKNKKELEEKNTFPVYTLAFYDESTKEVVVYGAGVWGKKAYNFLTGIGIQVLKFCDRNLNKQGKFYYDKEIISPEQLCKQMIACPIVVGISQPNSELVAQEIASVYRFSKIFLFDKHPLDKWPVFNSITPSGSIGFIPSAVHYQLHNVVANGKKIVLFGYIEDIIQVANKLSLLDIEISYAVSCESFVGEKAGIIFCSRYDLLYEDISSIMVWVLNGALEKAEEFAYEVDIDSNIFCYGPDGPSRIFRRLPLDPSLGYNVRYRDEQSVTILRSHNHETPCIKIGVLGGSTSETNSYCEKSWTEHFIDIADSYKLNIVLYNGAVSGYTSSQETLKFVRDMLNDNLDILISYNRINEYGYGENSVENLFISQYQVDTYQYLNKNNKRNNKKNYPNLDDICLGRGTTDYVENWLNQVRILHGICCEFGIIYHAIMQPILFEKKTKTNIELEILEHHSEAFFEQKQSEYIMQSIRNKGNNMKEKFNFIEDFTQIFDDEKKEIYFDACHLTSYGNKVLAKNIFDLLYEDVKKMKK